MPIFSRDLNRWCWNGPGKDGFGTVGILGVVFFLLYTDKIYGLVDESISVCGVCWTLGGAVGAGLYGCTIGGFNTGTTLVYGVDGRAIGGNNGFIIGTIGNISDNGKSGKHGWVVLICKILYIWLIILFVASP